MAGFSLLIAFLILDLVACFCFSCLWFSSFSSWSVPARWGVSGCGSRGCWQWLGDCLLELGKEIRGVL
jgi:hypothetical protein